jgi:Outer membrane protein beta-barrel domain
MKRHAILSTLAFCLALSVSATESFILSIPQGEDFTRQTGEVRVTLGLNAPPAGSQLVVGGNTTINLGQTVTVAGDSITFEAGAGNSARIIYRPLSNFAGPNNFCVIDPAVFSAKEVPMRFTGAQDIVDFRVSSYAVGAPGIECSKPFKRVGDFIAMVNPSADGVAPELSATFKGRQPLDVVLVLDSSGSMSERPPGVDSGPTKAEILRSAVNAFIAQWRQLDAPIIDSETGLATGVENSPDRLGIVFFDTTAAGQTISGGFFVPRGSGPIDPSHPWNNVIGTVNMLTPGGSTTIGGGINEGMRLWTEDPDHDLSIILVTDGKQNAAPLIGTVAEGSNVFLTLEPVAGLNDQLRRRFVPIQTIAFGTPANVDQELLSEVSLETNGRAFIAVTAGTMFNTFGQTLVSILKGNTVSTVITREGTMTGPGPSAPVPLPIDRSTPRFVVSLQWAPPEDAVLDLEVLRPGGAVATPTSIERLPQAAILRFDVRAADAGEWAVRVKRGQSTATMNVPYTLNAFVVEEKLEYRVNAGEQTISTGDAVNLRVNVAYDGKALDKLPPNAIRVRVQRPAEGLGTILRETPSNDPNGANTTTPSGDIETPYERKLSRVTNASLLQRILPRDVETITLAHQGGGIYAGTFNGTTVPGAYAFEFLLDWDDPRTGHVRRVERLETNVTLRPAIVPVTVTRGDGNRMLVAVTPRDRFGNYLGPGYGDRVRATLNGPGTISAAPVDRDQTGTYVFTVSDLPAGQTPDVTVTVDGANAGNTGSTPAPVSSGRWRAFFDAGISRPVSALDRRADGQFSFNAGVERLFGSAWSAELSLGHHSFEGLLNPQIWQLTIGGKRWFGSSPLRPFAGVAAGAYNVDPPGGTRAGANANVGVLYELTPRWSVEGVYSYHLVNTEGDSLSFTALQVGLRWAF